MADPTGAATGPEAADGGPDETGAGSDLRMSEVPVGVEVELLRIEAREALLEPLLERGFLPGCRLCTVRRAPSGDPILRLDGTVLALRRETAACLCVRLAASARGRGVEEKA